MAGYESNYADSYEGGTAGKRTAKMDLDTLRAMLATEFENAMGAMQASKLVSERADALDYYVGNMQKDMPAQDGRSTAVSFDVADTIEGLMPSLMEIFAGSDEVVIFDPTREDDVQAAEQETDYVNHVFMNENPGFMTLYSFLKDGLLSKVGIVKVWWDKREEEEKESYYDQPDDAYGLILNSPDIEVVEHSEHDDPANPGAKLHDVTIVRKADYSQACVMPVPPEEFVMERGARSLLTPRQEVNYCCHKVIKSEARLIEMGFDADQVKSLPIYRAYTNIEEINRDSVDEHQFFGDDVNQAARLKQVLEHYVRMDYDGSGKAKLYRVTTSGTTGEILNLDGKPDISEVDFIPFAVWTPIPITHRFWGRSIADVTMDIQRVKTALTRGVLDNVYLANQPRHYVAEADASENTLDDLLVSRPGGIVRGKNQGAVTPLKVESIAGECFPVLEYYDQLREWRTGVSRASAGLDANALQNQSATAVNQMYTAAQAKMKLIARIAAETGIRDLFWLLHATIRKHAEKARIVRLRNQWVPVDPRNWKARNDMTVRVGTGDGGKAQRLAEVTLIGNAQEKMLAGGLTNLVSPANLYNTAKLMVRAIGEKDVDAYFTNPQNAPPPQPQPNPDMMKIQGQLQLQQLKTQSDIETERARASADMALEQQKFEHQKQLDLLEMGMKREEHGHKIAQMVTKGLTETAPAEEVSGGKGKGKAPAQPAPNLAPLIGELVNHLKAANGPKRIVRDQHGRVSHVEPMTH